MGVSGYVRVDARQPWRGNALASAFIAAPRGTARRAGSGKARVTLQPLRRRFWDVTTVVRAEQRRRRTCDYSSGRVGAELGSPLRCRFPDA